MQKKPGYDVKSPVDFDEWIEDYRKAWLNTCKLSELEEVTKVLKKANETGKAWDL